MKYINKTIVCFAIFLCLLLTASDLFALHFRIDKAKVKINLPPGWSDGGVITVENLWDEPIDIRVYAGDWVYSDQDGSKVFLPTNSQPKSCAEWIKFYPASFTVPSHGRQKVNYVIAVPKDTSGGYYGVLFFEAEGGTAMDATTGAVVKVYNRIASLFLVEPEGTIEKKAEVSDINIEKTEGEVRIKANFSNTGNANITTKGIFDIIDQDGVVFTRGEFNEVYTMPQDKDKLFAKSEDTNLSAGKYDLTFDLEGDILVKEYQIEVSPSGSITAINELE